MTIEPSSVQNEASDPFISAWVAASAGSGKTKVLTDRVLRLMLLSGHPEKILCLTFTKVAAAEMLERLTQILKRWATSGEQNLIQEITELTQETPDTDILNNAKSLFSKVLEIPGGLKMMTIHSFCTSLLHRFPLEADVPPNFNVLDELTAQNLIQQSLNQVLENQDFLKDIEYLAKLTSQENLLKLFNNVLKDRATLLHLIDEYSDIKNILIQIKKYFDIQKVQKIKDLLPPTLSMEEWETLKGKYLKVDGEIKKAHIENTQAQEIYLINDQMKAFQIVQNNQIFFRLIYAILENYQHLKFKQNALDYDDLIDKTLSLLKTNHQSSWVLYKLDGGLDHILVDEAQDTNPKQWEIIAALTEDFFSGDTRSEALRTLFVVGDKKQSIYSFQGARPDEFEHRHQFFKQKIEQSKNTFKTIPFNFSFRSTQPVLDLVNCVLKNNEASDGVLQQNEEAFHVSKREKDAGLVEIWPLITQEKQMENLDWTSTTKRIKTESSMTQLCQKIAKKISNMIQNKEILLSKNRPIHAGDFLILLQKRGQMMEELVRALKEENVPVAGVDRLELTQHIAICDLLALVRFVLLPSDDLNLANLIKSPLLGLTEEDLFTICSNRENLSVWERIKKLYPSTAEYLKKIMNMADQVPPFDFFEYILDALEGRKKFIARLGLEVQEALDAFLDLALQFETDQAPSLQGFLNWMNQQDITIKRDMDQNQLNAVRIMTVHGSKGLQGNIVFLPDTRGTTTADKKTESLIWLENNLPVWVQDKKNIPQKLKFLFEKMDHANEQEKHRLLYVALTRASDRLYICGYDGLKKAKLGNWYDLILNSLGKETLDETIAFKSKQLKESQSKTTSQIPNDFENLPDWVNHPPKTSIQKSSILAPSKMGVLKEEASLSPSQNQKKALERGSFIHQLLQYLPNIPPEERASKIHNLTPPGIDVPSNLLDLIENSPIKDLFGPNSMAEVPLIGELDGQKISGQIDRLLIREKEVLIIDYKTNRIVPNNIPENYRQQLNVYKDLLKNIFPDKIVKCYLLWTENLTFMEVK